MTYNSQTYFYQYNGHGDVIALTDATGAVVATYDYDAFGNPVGALPAAGSVGDANPYRYAGYRWDQDTGLYYLNARYYWAAVGRFITRDTFNGSEDDTSSLNLYNYCKGNPIIYAEPSGHVTILIHGIMAGDLKEVWGMRYYLDKVHHVPDVYVYSWVKFYNAGGVGNVVDAWTNNGILPKDFANFIRGKWKKGQPLNIVAHSGGGQMTIEAAMILKKLYPSMVINKLILMDTPIIQKQRSTNIKDIYFATSYHPTTIANPMSILGWGNVTVQKFLWISHTEYWGSWQVRYWVWNTIK